MKKVNIFILMFFAILSVNAQELIGERVSDLMPEIYQIQGDGILQAFDNGVVTLSLSDNFSTPAGPDVRILLSNSLTLSGAVEIVNLTDINHFSGGYSIDLPENIDIEEYQFILFYCVQFAQFWASGEFGETTVIGNPFTCLDTSTKLGDGSTLVDLCPTDGDADLLNFSNSAAESGENYAYLLTDGNEVLQEVILDSSYDFEGSTTDIQRVYGIHYDGTLTPMIGEDRMQTTASGCFIHSSGDYLTITKTGCGAPFECAESLTATTNWVTSVDVCVTDGQTDLVPIRNNLFIPPGENYVFLFTDVNEILLEAVFDTIYDFEGTSEDELRVYGMSYDGELSIAIGEDRQNTTASECFIHSGGNLFLTVNKTSACLTPVLDLAVSDQISIYPNPVSDVLNISLPAEFEAEQLIIYDVLGKQVMHRDLQPGAEIQLDVNSLIGGNYTLSLNNGKDWYAQTISIVK